MTWKRAVDEVYFLANAFESFSELVTRSLMIMKDKEKGSTPQ
jgi:hypothetical protein